MALFTPLALRGVTLRNRIVVSPMCQYSATDGRANDWHLVHLGARAVGGAGLVMTEATAIEAQGRISLADLGLWDDTQIEPLARIVRFIGAQGAVAGIQLAHAGRKASVRAPWDRAGAPLGMDEGGYRAVAPSPLAFAAEHQVPEPLSREGIARVVLHFRDAATRALAAGFAVVEVHAAHGYLLHEFLSPLSNHRHDEYGGSLENRARLLCEVVEAIRSVWPERLPLFVRVSATDWMPGGWDITDTVALARLLGARGVDLIDCSSGGLVPGAQIPVSLGYQVPFAERVRHDAGVATGAVGLITTAEQADDVIDRGQADLVLIAREMLRDPYFPLHAAAKLGAEVEWPIQYGRAKR